MYKHSALVHSVKNHSLVDYTFGNHILYQIEFPNGLHFKTISLSLLLHLQHCFSTVSMKYSKYNLTCSYFGILMMHYLYQN